MNREVRTIFWRGRTSTDYGVVDAGGALVFGVGEAVSDHSPISLGLILFSHVPLDESSLSEKACAWLKCKPGYSTVICGAGEDENMLAIFTTLGRDAMWRELEAMFTSIRQEYPHAFSNEIGGK